MDFDDSGIDTSSSDFTFATDSNSKNEPIISFSPGRCRFDNPSGSLSISSSGNFPIDSASSILSFANISSTSSSNSTTIENGASLLDTSMMISTTNCHTSSSTTLTPTSSVGAGATGVTTQAKSLSKPSSSGGNTDLQRRLEKRIARANSNSSSPWTTSSSINLNGNTNGATEREMTMASSSIPGVGIVGSSLNGSNSTSGNSKENWNGPNSSSCSTSVTSPAAIATTTMTSLVNMNATQNQHQHQQLPQQINPNSVPSSSSSSGFGPGKLPSLLPPQRLAIPNKSSHHSNSGSTNDGSSGENKPLVQWESDDSEEELSFFPAPRNRGVLNDNLSIDNMSLDEEDDLHLSPPRPLSQRCPCDPRLLLDSHASSSSSSTSAKNCTIS